MNSKTASIVNWLAILASLAALAAVIANVYQRGFFSSEDEQEIVVSNQSRPAKVQRVDMEQIVNAHLFGQIPVNAQPVKKAVVAPKTQLKLTLTGLFEDPDDEKGRAIIDVQGGKTIVVKVGDQIAKTGAKLHQIEFNHVLIERGGNLEQLPMVRPEMTGMSALMASVQTNESVDESSLPQPRDEEFVLPEPEPEPEPVVESEPQADPQQAIEQNVQEQQQQQKLQRQQQLQQLQGISPDAVPQPFSLPGAGPGQGNMDADLPPPEEAT